jgi:cell division protein FtsB
MIRGYNRLLPIGLLGLTAVLVPAMIMRKDGLPRYRAMQEELRGIQRDNEDERREIMRLRAEIKSMREDPTAVERIARDQLGFVRKSEVVYQFSRTP